MGYYGTRLSRRIMAWRPIPPIRTASSVFGVSMLFRHTTSKTTADNNKRVHFLKKETYGCKRNGVTYHSGGGGVELPAVVLCAGRRGWWGGHRRGTSRRTCRRCSPSRARCGRGQGHQRRRWVNGGWRKRRWEGGSTSARKPPACTLRHCLQESP